MHCKIFKALFLTLLCGFVFASWLALFLAYLRIPEVHVSYTTNKCVRIIDYKGRELSCDNLKNIKKYDKVWAE